MSARNPFAWAPTTVRHLFRTARFGACSHGVRLYRLGPITWAVACGYADCRADAEPKGAVLFAVGHHLEVPGCAEPWNDERGIREFLARPVPTTREQVVRAVPREYVFLAEDLGVYEWAAAEVRGAWGAIGMCFGLPACVIAPNVGSERVLAPGGAS